MEDSIQFLSMIRLHRESDSSQYLTKVDLGAYAMIEKTIVAQGASIKVMNSGERTVFNIIGNDFDIMIMGEVQGYRTLARIDAVLKRQGFIAHTYPIVQSDEYRQLAEEVIALPELAHAH